jgi:hypothetical protein
MSVAAGQLRGLQAGSRSIGIVATIHERQFITFNKMVIKPNKLNISEAIGGAANDV